MLCSDFDIRRLMALRAVEAGLLRLKWLAAATRFELAMVRHHRALKLAYKYGYNPAQPRVPAGQREGGQWTVDANGNPVRPNRTRLAGEVPTGNSPEILKESPPTTRLRNIAIRVIAARLGPGIFVAAEAGSWIYDHKEEISAYFDPPKTLDELQKDAEFPEKGYDIHHVVERASAKQDGSEDGQIESPDNLVRISRWKHWMINGYYQSSSDEFGGLTPRKYLEGKSWEERTRVGLDALARFGILRK